MILSADLEEGGRAPPRQLSEGTKAFLLSSEAPRRAPGLKPHVS